MHRLPLYIRTLRHLHITQIWALLRRRLLPVRTQISRNHAVRLRAGVRFPLHIPHRRMQNGDQSFRFLNHERTFLNGQIDWTASDAPKLWRYNLHYFDYLFDLGRSDDANIHAISNWLVMHPPGSGDGWEPYTLSLRIVNWIKFFLCHEAAVTHEWLHSLYAQALYLEQNLEFHLRANHILKNGVALFFAGLYFDGADADRWLLQARKLLADELNEQFLQDGGHYERSPMYHAISVLDYLDVLNLMIESQTNMIFEELEEFKSRMRQALEFLNDLCLPDGDIPLFNDSALGIAPSPGDIMAYGSRIVGYVRRAVQHGLTIAQKSHTGYYIFRDGTDMLVLDCGAVGPDYQPGHAHADTLSFELALNGHRVIVDTGVYDYEPGFRRTYARSTSAHNTVCIDQENQSEIWGVFRVARRAYPLRTRLTTDHSERAMFEGAHDGYRRLPGRPIHRREIDYISPGEWTIFDTIEGGGIHTIESYLHIHPAFTVALAGRIAELRTQTGQLILSITPSLNAEVRTESGWYFPEFGKELPNTTLVMKYRGQLPVLLSYRMSKPPSSNTQFNK